MNAQSILSIAIQAKDMASGVLKSFGGQLDSVKSKSQELTSRGLSGLKTGIDKVVSAVTIGITAFGGFAAIAGGMALKSAADIETMSVSLETAMGGNAAAAKAAQDQITQFASKTPYELGEVMGAFIKLKNMGLDPSERALTAYGDTASAMGKSLNDMVEAVADAATGEFERLKEFGIRSESQGNKVKFTFKGVTTTVNKNSKEIEKYLIKLGETNFAGGMEKQSKTLSGMMSTLKDTIGLTLGQLAKDSGLLDAAKMAVEGITNALANFDTQPLKDAAAFIYEIIELLATGQVESGDGLFNVLGKDTKNIIQNINNVRGAVLDIYDILSTGNVISGDGIFAVFGSERGQQIIDTIESIRNNATLWESVLVGLSSVILTVVVGALASLVISIVAATWPFILMATVVGGLFYLFKTNQPLFAAVATGIALIAFTILASYVPAMWAAASATIAATWPIILIIGLISALVFAGVWLWQNWDTIVIGMKKIFGDLNDYIKKAFAAVGIDIDKFKNWLQDVWNKSVEVAKGIQDAFQNIQNGIGDALKGAVNGMIDNINKAIRAINSAQDGIPEEVYKVIGKNKGDLKIKEIPRLATGTNYVPQDMLAVIHKGEAVVPAKYNPANGGQEMGSASVNVTVNLGSYTGTAKDKRAFAQEFGDVIAQELKRLKVIPS